VIYFDNAATSWPKPPTVIAAMQRFMNEYGANPGRSGHGLSIQAGRVVYEARESVAKLFGHDDPLAVVFTKNATEALNIATLGLLAPGDHAITSCTEHNAVMRPLRILQSRGVSVTRVPYDIDGAINPADIKKALTAKTKLVVLTHGSNVTGTLLPIEDVGLITEQHGALFCVDAAQTAGSYPIDMRAMRIDLLAFTGHKALYGPQGTGGLCIGRRARNRLTPLLYGGTGSSSYSDIQPDFLPDQFESGTLNGVGLAGLNEGISFVESQGIALIREREQKLTAKLLDGLREISGITLYGPSRADRRIAIVSFNIDGWSCSEVASEIEERAGICCRAGLHCAPVTHEQLGTFPLGTVRFSFGFYNKEEEIDSALKVLRELARQRR
jgi:cysteine desulfurase / selenocysteine lyase